MSVSEVSASQRQNSPYAAVGVLITTWSDGSQGAGTCAVIGRNDVLTALHCVYDPDKGGWAEKLEFYFGADYNSKTNSFDSSDWAYSLTSGFTWEIQGWPTAAFKDSANNTMTPSEAAYDVAIIGVSRPIGDITGWFGLDSGKNISAKATQVGYPVSSTGMMTSEIMVTKNLLWEVYQAQADNMGSGSSGGPLFTSDNQIIGVKSSGNSTSSTWTDIGHLFEEIVSITEDNDLLLGNKAIYSLTAPKSANEGGTASFTLITKNVTVGTAVPYTISGVSAADISGSLSGTAVVNTSGVATISVTLVNDNLTEGAETLTVTAGGASASTTVKDTSITQIVNPKQLAPTLTEIVVVDAIESPISPASIRIKASANADGGIAFFRNLSDPEKLLEFQLWSKEDFGKLISSYQTAKPVESGSYDLSWLPVFNNVGDEAYLRTYYGGSYYSAGSGGSETPLVTVGELAGDFVTEGLSHVSV